MEYGGFWRRLGAFFVDVVSMLPLVLPIVYLGLPWSQSFLLYWFLPSLAIGLAYNVVLVSRFGGTPGQLQCKLRVCMLRWQSRHTAGGTTALRCIAHTDDTGLQRRHYRHRTY